MFLENTKHKSQHSGWIEVIAGSMFSGKTEELLRRLKRATIAGQKVEVFKPQADKRYSERDVVSHDANQTRSTPVPSPWDILERANGCEVVGIDEAQFFAPELVEVCRRLADQGRRVVVAGLDMDFRGHPFGPMPQLMACAEYVTKVHAICIRCGALAHFSHRTLPNQELVMLGQTDTYEPLCRTCYNDAQRP